MKKVHYKELIAGRDYFLDDTCENIGIYLRRDKKSVYFKSVVNHCFAEHDGVIVFATFPNLHFYEIEKQPCE